MKNKTKQVVIIHLSDLHFGKNHRFNSPKTPYGDSPRDDGRPSLLKLLQKDLEGEDPCCPVIICITGDISETASAMEFREAEKFINDLSKANILGKARGLESIFLVPGNHDLAFSEPTHENRWYSWTNFYNNLFKSGLDVNDELSTVSVIDRSNDLGVVAVCLNSCLYNFENSDDQNRGRISTNQSEKVYEQLNKISKSSLNDSIKIVLVHHHPVLIPALTEGGRGYDAIIGAGQLLDTLREFGFHIILHGHKHNPFTFTEDSIPAYDNTVNNPIFIVSAGSAGSHAIPNNPNLSNCYNKITIKWHPSGQQSRVRVETRKLIQFKSNHKQLIPSLWHWDELKVDDRTFFGINKAPLEPSLKYRPFDEEIDKNSESKRIKEYERLRGNMPVVEVMPSLAPGQAYDAVFWVERHINPNVSDSSGLDVPESVTWSAGKKFPVIESTSLPDFVGRYSYWGPMNIQARILFKDGQEVLTNVYARLPRKFELK